MVVIGMQRPTLLRLEIINKDREPSTYLALKPSGIEFKLVFSIRPIMSNDVVYATITGTDSKNTIYLAQIYSIIPSPDTATVAYIVSIDPKYIFNADGSQRYKEVRLFLSVSDKMPDDPGVQESVIENTFFETYIPVYEVDNDD